MKNKEIKGEIRDFETFLKELEEYLKTETT